MQTLSALAAGAAMALTALGGAAWAQNSFGTGGMTVREVSAILVSEGLAAKVAPGDEAGKIFSQLDGVAFEVLSANCSGGGRCTEFLFIAGFDLPDGFPIGRINEWNAEQLAGRAFLDHEDDPFIDHVVSVSGPGDYGAMREGLSLWRASLEAFVEFIDKPRADV
ncbi:MAG: YbjN domain-containing protein [Pseudomonadota bacterium]